jgi:flagellar motor component MotA
MEEKTAIISIVGTVAAVSIGMTIMLFFLFIQPAWLIENYSAAALFSSVDALIIGLTVIMAVFWLKPNKPFQV